MDDVGYCPPRKLTDVHANGLMFHSYAKAYRLTGLESLREMTGKLASGMGWGLLDSPIDFRDRNSVNSGQDGVCSLFGFLELYEAGRNQVFLDSAISLGKRLLQECNVDGLISSGSADGTTHIDSALPLALLHVEAAKAGGRKELPAFYPNNTTFDPKIVIRKKAGG